MSALDTWMPLYIGDFERDTADLSMEQQGCYLALLRRYWVSGPLPDDDGRLALICKMTRTHFVRHVAPSLRPFFTSVDGRLHQKRADAELEKRQKISEKRAENARKTGQKPPENPPSPDQETNDINGLPQANACANAEQMPPTSTFTENREKKQIEEPPPPKAKAKRAAAAPLPEVPGWMPQPAWNDYVESRRQMRKPLTPIAVTQLVRKLDGWRQRGLDIASALNASTAAGWMSVNEPKGAQIRMVSSRPTSADNRTNALREAGFLDEPPRFDLEMTADGRMF